MSPDAFADQLDCTEAVVEITPNAAIISNLGVASYILSAVDDRERNFYMRGAMGVTTPTGLGLALALDKQVAVLDGDGSMLMSLGALTTIARQDPENLVVVVMDNSEFATTGGQPSLANETDFAEVARDCGLKAWRVDSVDAFRDAYEMAVEHDGAALVSADVVSNVPDDYPRPDYAHSQLKHQFRSAVLDE